MEVYIPSITYWMGAPDGRRHDDRQSRGFSEKGRIFLIQFLMGNTDHFLTFFIFKRVRNWNVNG